MGVPRSSVAPIRARLLTGVSLDGCSSGTDPSPGLYRRSRRLALALAIAACIAASFAGVASATTPDKIIQGTINTDGTVASGSGFTSSRTAIGDYTITFTSAFTASPVVEVTELASGAPVRLAVMTSVSASSFSFQVVDASDANHDTVSHFVAIPAGYNSNADNDSATDVTTTTTTGGGTGASFSHVIVDSGSLVASLSTNDGQRMDLVWWGVWTVAGLLVILIISPMLTDAFRFWR